MAKPPQTFVREATGLVREISTYRSFVFNIMNTGPAFMLIFLVVGQGLFPGAYLPLSSILVLIPAIILAYVYAQMSTAFPRSGGDYIFVGRVLHPSLGFMVNFVMFVIQDSIIGVLAVWITTMALGPMFSGLGVLYNDQSLTSVGSVLVQPTNQFIIAALAIIITTGILFFGINVTFKVNSAFWILSLISLVLFLVVAGTTPVSTFTSNFNSLSSTSYSQYISAAQSAGAKFSYNLSDTLLAVIYTLLAVWGFTFSSYVGGEVKNPQRSQLLGMMYSAVIYIAIMAGVTAVAYYSFGHDFLASIGYLAVSGNSAYTLPSFPTMQFLVTYIAKNPLLEVIMTVGLLASLLAAVGTILPFVQIRMLFSWSFDGLLPRKFADVNEKYHVPQYILLLMIIVNLIFVYLAIYTPFSSYFTYNVTASLFGAGIVGLAAAFLPRRKKDLFDASPPLVSRRVAGIPLISILGGLLWIIGWSISYASLLPAIAGPLNPFYIGFVVALFVIGLTFYWVVYAVQRSRAYPLTPCSAKYLPNSVPSCSIKFINKTTCAAASLGDSQSSQKKLFVRDATGLVKSLSRFDLFNLSFGQIGIGGAAVFVLGVALGVYPNSNVPLAFIIGTPIIGLGPGLVYAYLASAMPRSGGEYVYNSRIIHPAIGFMSNFVFTFAVIGGIASISVIVPGLLLNVFTSTVGQMIGNAYLINSSGWFATQTGELVVGTIMIIVFSLLMGFATRPVWRFLKIFTVVALVGIIVNIIFLNITPHSAFLNAFEAQFPGQYQGTITQATKAGWVPGFTSSSTALSLLYVASVFVGFQYASYAGGEAKHASKSMLWAIMGSLIVGGLLFAAWTFGMYNAFGSDFFSAANYLSQSGASLPFAPSVNYLFTLIPQNPLIELLGALAFPLSFIVLQPTNFIPVVRNMFAWSFDRVAPEKLSYVNERTHTPIYAIALTAVLGETATIIFIYTSLSTAWSNATLMIEIAILLASVSAILFPYRAKAIYEQAPGFVKAKIIGFPVITIIGIYATCVQLFILYAGLTNPIIGGSPASYPILAGMIVLGLAFYYVEKWYRGRKGVDISLAFKELPPE